MIENATAPIVNKKSIERSASYPGIAISDALAFVGTISKNFTPQHVITRDDISAVTKLKTVHRITAAAVQYGLLSLVKGGYQISQLYRDYLNPVSEDEKKNNLLTFFKSPKLYADLIEKYNQHVIPSEFRSVLIRFHKIAPNAAEEVANIFIENAKYVGVLSDADILDVGALNIQNIEKANESKIKHESPALKPEHTTGNEGFSRIPDIPSTQEDVKLVLTENKYCFIKYPKNLTEKDVMILRKWIELLELTI